MLVDSIIHKHKWQFDKKFIAQGKPKLTYRLISSEVSMHKGEHTGPKIEMSYDCRQEYTRLICICGERKVIRLNDPYNSYYR